MLLELQVSNFRSFDEEQTLSLVASRDMDHEEVNVFNEGRFRILKAAALYGANASGKTNLIRAMYTVREFVSNSATEMNLGDAIQLQPFALGDTSRAEPSGFKFVLLIDGTRYDYGFEATRERVYSEWIVAYPKLKPQRWLERNYDKHTDSYKWLCRGPLKKEERGLSARTRQNGLALSRGAERNIEALAPLYLWFKNRLRILDQSQSPDGTMGFSLDLFKESEDFREFTRRLVGDADMGIVELELVERQVGQAKFPDDVPSELQKVLLRKLKEGPHVEWAPVHRNLDTGGEIALNFADEAGGTRRLLALAGPWWDTLQNGYTVAVDELDCSMHPLLVRKLVELFQSPVYNRNGAQLVFSTHDATLIDLSLFRRDQIWLFEKLSSGASTSTSLYDFEDRPRKQEAISRGYLAGRYGGVPSFGPMLEDIE